MDKEIWTVEISNCGVEPHWGTLKDHNGLQDLEVFNSDRGYGVSFFGGTTKDFPTKDQAVSNALDGMAWDWNLVNIASGESAEIKDGKTKVKKTARSFRIWVEGKKLEQAGFGRAAPYEIAYCKGGIRTIDGKEYGDHSEETYIELRITHKGRQGHKVRRVTKSRPIIDLSCQEIGNYFPAGTQLVVEYSANKIVFKEA
tara:strand:+ start:614 stop:1210 length:597 start_codon:yes stop_codon:yes gene_type:complete